MPVLQDVDFSVRASEIVALVGENGAGKSTLMKIVSGITDKDEGRIIVQGAEVQFRSVHDAEALGVVLVPQELRIAPESSVAENMFVGHLPANVLGIVQFSTLESNARKWLKVFQLNADPFDAAGSFSTSEQRMIMIAGALSKNASILLLDEPTAALTDAETQQLFRHVGRLRDHGMGVVLITHRLDEVEQIADRVVVMRNGKIVDHFGAAKGRRREIVRAMIGRDLDAVPRRNHNTARTGDVVLAMNEMSVEDPDVFGKLRVREIDLTLRAGEILGLYGLIGAGRTELARALYGDWPGRVTGDVRILGRSGLPKSPRDALRRGVAMLTEDRRATGVFDGHSVSTNLSAASLDSLSVFGIINRDKEYGRNMAMIERLDVRPPQLSYTIELLSGGNQQKVLLGKSLNIEPKILILDEPTLGVDVGARFQIYQSIAALADNGLAVLMISSDVDEVLLVCDRIVVMYKGRKVDEMTSDRSRERLVAAATGGGI